MRIPQIALATAAALVALPPGARAQARGEVQDVRAVATPESGVVQFRVTGRNPCGAVFFDYGNGEGITHAIERLPVTLGYEYHEVGNYRIIARGQGNCDGEVRTTVRVVTAAPRVERQRPEERQAEPRGRGRGRAVPKDQMRFAAMDRNQDGIITRAEWRGSEQSFAVHDWNNDGVLSGDEVRTGARRGTVPDYDVRDDSYRDWTRSGFRALDHDGNGRITLDEWHFDIDDFWRVDRNRDRELSLDEFLGLDFDDDRGDRFDYVDQDHDGRIERREWHSSSPSFDWLDANHDGWLSRSEVDAELRDDWNLFQSLDVNRDGAIALDEWHWSRNSFDIRDRDRNGRLSPVEFGGADERGGDTSAPAARVDVPATERWTDTGVTVRAGERIAFEATGRIRLSHNDTLDFATPAGSRMGRLASEAPLPRVSAGALIGRIGNGAPFLIGDSTAPVAAERSGRLYLSVNDDYLADNTGGYQVAVTVIR